MISTEIQMILLKMYAVALFHRRLSFVVNALMDFKCFTFQFTSPHIFITEEFNDLQGKYAQLFNCSTGCSFN